MNIILLSTSTTSSGGLRQAMYMAQGFMARGHTLRFFTPAECELRKLDPALPWRDLPTSYLEAQKILKAEVLALSQDKASPGPVILHAFHNKGVKMAAFFGTLWGLQKLPVACCAHRGVIYRPRNPLPYILPGIKAFIVNSQACADTLPLWGRKNRCHVVYNAVPPERLKTTRTPQEMQAALHLAASALDMQNSAPIIGCVANNSANKGVEFLLKAFMTGRFVEKYSARLVIVGVDPKIFSPLAHSLGLDKHVRLVPPTEHVADYLQIFSLFVLPSMSESQPNTLLEAMSLGLPAVGSRVGGVPEVLADEKVKADVLFTPGNMQDFIEKVDKVLQDKALATALGERNREYSKNFQPEVRLTRVMEIYEQALREVKSK